MYIRTIVIALSLLTLIGVGAWVLAQKQPVQEQNAQYKSTGTSTANEIDSSSTASESVREPMSISLATSTVLNTEDELSIQLASPLSMHTAARELGKVRFMAESPDGRIFAPDLVDYKLSHEGTVYILDDFNPQTKQFETTHTYLSDLRGPNSLAFYTDDDGQQWLYLALTAKLVRYPYQAGDTEPRGEPEVIARFPNEQAKSANSVVWHITRTIEFHNGRLFVSVGSGCNACEQEGEAMRGMIYEMAPDGSDQQVYARGLRNAVGFDFVDGTLYATENGADHLGPNAPNDVVYQLERGEHYGWPYCYEQDGVIQRDTTRSWQADFNCSEVPQSFASLEPHAAPLGITYIDNVHPALNNTMLVAQHGSFEPRVGTEPKVLRLTRTGSTTPLMRGFENAAGERVIRPVDFHRFRDGFLMSDDIGGRIFYIEPTEVEE